MKTKFNGQHATARLVLGTTDLTADMDFLIALGFQLDQIFPSDDPMVARLSAYGISIQLDKNEKNSSPHIHLQTDTPIKPTKHIAPNGATFTIAFKNEGLYFPNTQHKFEVRKLQKNDAWVIGRAGMLYRDLIPDRLGGSIIASHIHIPKGGPVPDMVHYHTIGFQLIFCYKGWVKLVYEDQGAPFILNAGDCVTQPPEIRHRVLEASDNLQVIEIGVPASHMTTIDHEMTLPTPQFRPDRQFSGQTFCHHKAPSAEWRPTTIQNLNYRNTGVDLATQNQASVRVLRATAEGNSPSELQQKAGIHFSFIMDGELSLAVAHDDAIPLQKGDAFVIPPKTPYYYQHFSKNLAVLEVCVFDEIKTYSIKKPT
jgi:quercetin dioxygenase-like cupin family protein